MHPLPHSTPAAVFGSHSESSKLPDDLGYWLVPPGFGPFLVKKEIGSSGHPSLASTSL